MLATSDRQLSPDEIEAMTGIEPRHYVAQANKLKRDGIKCTISARKEVVVWLSWVQMAGIQQVVINMPGVHSVAKNDELVLDFSALEGLDGGRNKKKQTG